MSEEGSSTDTRQRELTRLAGAMRALADWGTPLDTSGDAMFGPGVEVVCRGDAHAGTPVHVQWLFPEALPGVNADALLVEDEPLDTLKAALLRRGDGDAVRARYRLECPVCGERGTVVTSADPYGPGGVLTRAQQAIRAGVSQLDLYGLQRYISD